MKHRKNYSLLLIFLLFLLNACAQKQDCAFKSANDPCLTQLLCPTDFTILKGEPLSNQFSQVESVKLVYEISSDQLFFINARKYHFHYNFCQNYLGYNRGLSIFNTIEYGDTDARHYILANLNYYKSSNVYTLEFFADDKVSPEQIRLLLNRVDTRVYFKNNLYLVVKDHISDQIAGIDAARFISVDKLFGNQQYQPMVLSKSYGRFTSSKRGNMIR
jgi:pyruvate,water dikinase